MASLYVARDKRRQHQHDLGSVLCLNVLDLLPKTSVEVVECIAPMEDAPSWLFGTPTVHFHETDEVYRGHAALSALERAAVDVAARDVRSEKRVAREPDGPKRSALKAVPSNGTQMAFPNNPIEEVGTVDLPGGDDLSSLWEEDDVSEVGEDSKQMEKRLTSDDLDREMQKRRGAVAPQAEAAAIPSNGPKAPAPLKD